MANYADITDADGTWRQMASATEATIISIKRGRVELCKASASPATFSGSGILVVSGGAVIVNAGSQPYYRSAGSDVPLISRSAFDTSVGGF